MREALRLLYSSVSPYEQLHIWGSELCTAIRGAPAHLTQKLERPAGAAVNPGNTNLLHMLAAVDGDVCSGNERGLFRAQIYDQPRNFLGLAQT